MIKYKMKFRIGSNLMSTLEQNSVSYYLKTKLMGNLGRCQGRGTMVKSKKKGMIGTPLGRTCWKLVIINREHANTVLYIFLEKKSHHWGDTEIITKPGSKKPTEARENVSTR